MLEHRLNCWNVVCGKWKLETVQNSTMLQSLLSNQDCDFKSLEIILEIYREVVKSSLGRAISHHIALLKSGSYSYLTLFSRQGNVDTYAKHTHEHQKWDLSSISSAFNRGAISRQPQWNVKITTRQSQLSASITQKRRQAEVNEVVHQLYA